MNYNHLTEPYFLQFKKPYNFYGTQHELDAYGNEYTIRDADAKTTITTMWHPLDDRVYIAEYGQDFDKVIYCIAYGDGLGIEYGDRVYVGDAEYEVVAVRCYNTHTRIDAKRMKVI